jgi:hypothetical protein
VEVDGTGGGGSGFVTAAARGAVDHAGLQFGDGLARISYTSSSGRVGMVWSPPQEVDASGAALSAVSCPNPSFCVAVDSAGHAVVDRAGAWSAPVGTGVGNLAAVSCASDRFCVAVGTAASATEPEPVAAVYRQGVWSPSTLPAVGPDEILTGVSCVKDTTYCMVVGYFWFGGPGPSTLAQTFNGRTWTVLSGAEIAGYATGDYLWAVSCTSRTFCAAGGFEGDRNDFGNMTATDTDGTWSFTKISDANTIGAPGDLDAIACPVTGSCLAAGPGGYVFTDDGGQWSEPTDVDGTAAVSAVSCADASTCVAVDRAGAVLTAGSNTWSAPVAVDPGQALDAVSCPTKRFCVATDTAGDVVVGS